MTQIILAGGYSQTSDLAGPAEFDRLTGVPQSLVHVSYPMQNGSVYTSFPVVLLAALWTTRQQLALLTLGTWDYSTGRAWPWADIVSGKYDAYLHLWAQTAAAWRHPFFIRLDHEINGMYSNLPYTALATVDPAGYLAAWKHIVDLFRADGASNATWVWNINSVTPAMMGKSTDADRVAHLYPGDSYVDWTSFDTYNWAGSKQGMPWLSWQQIVSGYSNWIGDTYSTLTALSSKPILVGELGCDPRGGPTGVTSNGDKTAWISDMLKTTPVLYPRIGALSWFQRSYAPAGPMWALDGYDGTAWGLGIKAGPYAIPGQYPMPPDLQPIQPLQTTTTWGDPYKLLTDQVTTAQTAQGTAEGSQTALEGLVRARKAAQGAEDAAVN